jgi:hypothetical protein
VRNKKVVNGGAVVRSKTSDLDLLPHSLNNWCDCGLRGLERVQWLVFSGEEDLAIREDSTRLTLDRYSKGLDLLFLAYPTHTLKRD